MWYERPFSVWDPGQLLPVWLDNTACGGPMVCIQYEVASYAWKAWLDNSDAEFVEHFNHDNTYKNHK